MMTSMQFLWPPDSCKGPKMISLPLFLLPTVYVDKCACARACVLDEGLGLVILR